MTLVKVTGDKIDCLRRSGEVGRRKPMSSVKELEKRVTTLEVRMDEEAELRAGVDREVSDVTQALRAQQRSIQALAVTQSEHTRKLDRLTGTVDRLAMSVDRLVVTVDRHEEILVQHGEILGRHEEILVRHEVKLDQLAGKLDQHDGKLDRIIATLDRLIGAGGR
jgi:chromosome segregation ATPase